MLYNNHDLANYITKYEVISKREKSLEMLKNGFNIADCLEVMYFSISYKIE